MDCPRVGGHRKAKVLLQNCCSISRQEVSVWRKGTAVIRPVQSSSEARCKISGVPLLTHRTSGSHGSRSWVFWASDMQCGPRLLSRQRLAHLGARESEIWPFGRCSNYFSCGDAARLKLVF